MNPKQKIIDDATRKANDDFALLGITTLFCLVFLFGCVACAIYTAVNHG